MSGLFRIVADFVGRRAMERAARGASNVELCGQLRWVGWEHLHALDDGGLPLLFLLPPVGSPSLARRALEAFRPGASADSMVLWGTPAENEAAARRALDLGAAAVFAYALAEGRRRFAVHFEAPIVPRVGEDAASLVRRWRAALDEILPLCQNDTHERPRSCLGDRR